MDPVPETPKQKTPVVRGARACTVCRAAKMKCVGAEDGQRQCQRCKRSNSECVFEKHRRGRKPGSKLSEASKMLRRLEKGLSSKIQTQPPEPSSPYATDELRSPSQEISYNNPMHSPDSATAYGPPYPLPEPVQQSQPPPQSSSYQPYQQPTDSYSTNPSRSIDADDDDDDQDKDEAFFPAKLIKRENQRNSFFRTILNPDDGPSSSKNVPRQSNSASPPRQLSPPPVGLTDPITAGIITEHDAQSLFNNIYLRLNPFVNLFDPTLHTVSYVRSKCPFLFTTLIMAGCKFFKQEKYKQCQKLANKYAVRAFEEGWKRVEVVQAYACMTYWKEPDDTRTWSYIGIACRMAVELNLNRYVPNPSPHETDFQKLERRNRERTYLVLFVHDRALSMQCNKHWMLPEDELVRHSGTWHEKGGAVVRPEDVIVGAFVHLRRIAAETTDTFHAGRSSSGNNNSDINYEHVLSNCNSRLTQWDDTWRHEMQKARGDKFHFSFLTFFRLYVRIFLNSFGIRAGMHLGSSRLPSMQALSSCTTSALDSLQIACQDFQDIHVLRYGQDSVMIMTAYSALTLLKLLRDPHTKDHMTPVTSKQIHDLITRTAESYQEAANAHSQGAAYHARFLMKLIMDDIEKYGSSDEVSEMEEDPPSMPIDPRLQAPPAAAHGGIQTSQVYPHQSHRSVHEQPAPTAHQQAPQHAQASAQQAYHYTSSSSSTLAAHAHPSHPQPAHAMAHDHEYQHQLATMSNGNSTTQAIHYPNSFVPMPPQAVTELDAMYWKNMFIELGFGEPGGMGAMPVMPSMGHTQYMDTATHHPQPLQHPSHVQLTHQMHYQPMQPY